jgi:hypothetical protein
MDFAEASQMKGSGYKKVSISVVTDLSVAVS